MLIFRNIEDIAEFLAKIPNGNLSVFFGAGVSLNSGIPLANMLKMKVLEAIKMEQYWEVLKPIPFEQFMEFLFRFSDEGLDLMDVFKKGSPNLFHLLLAYLIQCNKVKNVMTTNFDMLLEKACCDIGIFLNRFYQEQHFIHKNINYPSLIKIHGSIEVPQTARMFLFDISKAENVICRRKILEDFFCKSDEEFILVMGYSCSDKFDIIPFLNSLENSKKQILFIEHFNFENSDKILVTKNKGCFRHFKGYNIKCNTDLLLEKWANKEKFEISKTLIYPSDWEKYCINVVKYIGYRSKLFIAALLQHRTLFYESSLIFETLIKEQERALSVNEKIKVYCALSFNLFNLISIKKIKKSEMVDKYYYIRKAKNLIKDYPDIEQSYKSMVYSQYAKLFILDKKIKEAIEMYNRIEAILNRDSSTDKECKYAMFYNGLGELYEYMYRKTKDISYFALAKENYKLSFDFFTNKGGYMLEKGIIYYNLANILLEEPNPDFEKIKLYISESSNISKMLGDYVGQKLCVQLRKKYNKKVNI